MKKVKKVKEEVLFCAGYITKGKDKGKYVAVKVNNSQLLNPVAPIFELHKGMEYIIVGRKQARVKEIFSRVVMAEGGLINVLGGKK